MLIDDKLYLCECMRLNEYMIYEVAYLICFWNSVLGNPGWLWTLNIDGINLLPLPPHCWDFKYVPPCATLSHFFNPLFIFSCRSASLQVKGGNYWIPSSDLPSNEMKWNPQSTLLSKTCLNKLKIHQPAQQRLYQLCSQVSKFGKSQFLNIQRGTAKKGTLRSWKEAHEQRMIFH